MKYKIGDEVYLSEDSRWNNGSSANPLNTVGIIDYIALSDDEPYGVMWSNGKHNCCYSDDCLYTKEKPKTVVEITQEEYDSLIDEINLLRELLAEVNNHKTFVKPIEDYTLEDWQLALEEGAVFEDANGDEIKLLNITTCPSDNYPVETDNGSYTVKGWYWVDNRRPKSNIVRRIK